MRFHEITRLDEAIVTRPRNLGAFVRKCISELDSLLADAERAKKAIEANEDGDSLLRTFLRYGTDHAEPADDLYQVTYIARSLERHLPLENLRENLKAYLNHGPNFLRYVLGSFDYVDPLGDRSRAVFAILDAADAGARAYGYEPGSEDDDYHAAMNLRDGLRLLANVIARGEKLWTTIKTKLGEVAKARAQGERYRPDHGEVETLYHASAFATEIVRDGFRAEKPDGRRGLGNYGSQKGISFTHDLKIAQDLMRALKDVWMIAHGELTPRQIISWIIHEGLDITQIERTLGLAFEEPNEHPGFPPRRRLKRLHEITGAEDTAKLYRVYLAFTKLRTDPVFTYIEETLALMKTRSITDIGVISCEVRLEPEDEYLVGESEFRLPANRVLSIKRLL